MRRKEAHELKMEAERLERIATDVEELGPGGKFQADKIRHSAKVIRKLIHGSGTGKHGAETP